MALLDSLIAFALTLAALATVVTILMEIIIRFFGLKHKGQVALVRRLVDKVVSEHLPQKESQWNVVKGILENPFSATKMVPEGVKQRYVAWKAGGIYNDVSLEHVLRRLLETAKPEVLQKAEDDLKQRLEIIATKYEEFSSALGANFKRNAQTWSIVIGIIVAAGMNVDGVRLLTTYLQDPTLRQSVIEKLPAPEQNAKTKDDINAYIEDLKTRLSDISDLELPIGSAYFPHCQSPWLRVAGDTSPDSLCADNVGEIPGGTYLLWLLKVVTTGILIGLGAPFWYDVAKRLAAVRSAFGGKPSSDDLYRGSDAREKSVSRDALLNSVVRNAKAANSGGAAS